MLPNSRPLGTVDENALRVCGLLVQLDLERIGVPFDQAGEGIPVLLDRWSPQHLVRPYLAASFRLIHLTSVGWRD
jgi:hypothetical protein